MRYRFGTIESVRLRSLPLKEGVKLPRKAAIAGGHIETDRASAHAYVVFSRRASAAYALQLNMSEVSMLDRTAVKLLKIYMVSALRGRHCT